MKFVKFQNPTFVFTFFGLLFGIAFIIFTPPFQVPDEDYHFFRSYQIAQGDFIAQKQDNRLGGILPASLGMVTKKFQHLKGDINSTTDYTTIKNTFQIPLNKQNQKFYDFPYIALYSPVAYLPQSLVIFLAQKLNSPPLLLMYTGRIAALFFWVLILFWSIKITPIGKWIFVVLALLPMSVFQNSSLSADMMTNSLSFLTLAFFLKIAFKNTPISIREIISLMVITLLLTLTKTVYFPLVFLYFIIPLRNVGSRVKYWNIFGGLLLINGVALITWGQIIKQNYIPYQYYNQVFRDLITLSKTANIELQTQYVLEHPFQFMGIAITSFWSNISYILNSYIGVLGWMDTPLPNWIITLSCILILITIVNAKTDSFRITSYQRLIFLLIGISTIVLILLSQYLSWIGVGSNKLHSIMGRYFIPAFPCIFISLFGILQNNFLRGVKKLILPVSLLVILLSCSTILVKRYFSNYETIEQYYNNVENITIKSQKDTLSLTQEQVYDGNYAIKLTKKNPYGMSATFQDVKKGERFRAKVWRHLSNRHAKIVANSKKPHFYLHHTRLEKVDSSGWECRKLSFVVPEDLDELKIYVWNPTDKPAYFDNLTVWRGK